MRRGLTARLVAATGALALLVGGAFAVLVAALREERQATALSRESELVLSAANELERLVIDLETGQRGFVITGEGRFLEPWSEARARIPEAAQALEQRTVVPLQDRRARRITAAVSSYVEEYSVPLVEAARRGDESVASVEATEDGKRLVDAIRAEFDRLLATERALASDRQDGAEDATRWAIVASTMGLAGSVALISVFGGYLTRSIVRPLRRASAMAGQLASGDLAVRMPETGAGEIGQLERSFNTMAESLEQSRHELAASRARVVQASDETRRRIERDLHDGAQQRLVSLGLDLRAAEASVPPGCDDLRTQLSAMATGLAGVVEDLQEMSRGIHPAILSKGGLAPALKTLARRSAVPVELQVGDDRRLPEAVEVAAYYVVSEALTNTAKHAGATGVSVIVDRDDGVLRLSVCDDGVGGADPRRGSGLVGLRDRVESVGGTFEVTSPATGGTTLVASIPIEAC